MKSCKNDVDIRYVYYVSIYYAFTSVCVYGYIHMNSL